ncbi:DUF6788 family protein [Halalkalicoccus ordinarius]|uniref:DUF6788 family protein n=1 Tax=Halalkalicoccus ordinarius TaxID=3116651 RepID=UPI00300E82A8
MTTPSEPVAPDSLPKYLADGLSKQDREILEDVREYVEALLNYHALLDEQPIDESYLPEDAELVEETPKGSIMNEFRTCGDESCHCMSGGEKHGPYRYRVYREEGEVKKEYLGKAE